MGPLLLLMTLFVMARSSRAIIVTENTNQENYNVRRNSASQGQEHLLLQPPPVSLQQSPPVFHQAQPAIQQVTPPAVHELPPAQQKRVEPQRQQPPQQAIRQQEQPPVQQQQPSPIQRHPIPQNQQHPQQMPTIQRPIQGNHQPQLIQRQEQKQQKQRDQVTAESNPPVDIKGFKSVVIHKPTTADEQGGGLRVQDPPKGWPFSEVHMNFNSHSINEENSGNIVTARPEDLEDNRQNQAKLQLQQELAIRQQNQLRKQQLQMHQQQQQLHKQMQSHKNKALHQHSGIKTPPIKIQPQQILHSDQSQQNTFQHPRHAQPLTIQQQPQHPIQSHQIPSHTQSHILPQHPIQNQNVHPLTYPPVTSNIQQENAHLQNPRSHVNKQVHESRSNLEIPSQSLKTPRANQPKIGAHNTGSTLSHEIPGQNKPLQNVINKDCTLAGAYEDCAASPTKQTVQQSGYANSVNQHNVAIPNTGNYEHNQEVEADPNYVWRDIGQGMEISSNTPNTEQVSIHSDNRQKNVKTSTGQKSSVVRIAPNYVAHLQDNQIGQIHAFDHAHALGNSAIFGYKDAIIPTQLYEQPLTLAHGNAFTHVPFYHTHGHQIEPTLQDPALQIPKNNVILALKRNPLLGGTSVVQTHYNLNPVQPTVGTGQKVLLKLNKNIVPGSLVLGNGMHVGYATASFGNQGPVITSHDIVPQSTPIQAFYIPLHAGSIGQQTGHTSGVQSSSAQPSGVPLPTEHTAGVQLTGNPSDVQLATGHPPGVQLSTGHVPGIQLSTGHPPGVQLSTGHPPGVQLSTGHVPGIQLSTGHPPGVQLSTGHPSGVQLSTGHPPGVQLSTGHPPDIQLSTGHPPGVQLSTGHVPGVVLGSPIIQYSGVPVYNSLPTTSKLPVLHGSLLGVKPLSTGTSSQMGNILLGGNHGILPNNAQTIVADPGPALKSTPHSNRDTLTLDNRTPRPPSPVTNHQGPAMFPQNNLHQNTFGLKIRQHHPIPPPNLKSGVPTRSSTNFISHAVPSPLSPVFGFANLLSGPQYPLVKRGLKSSLVPRYQRRTKQ